MRHVLRNVHTVKQYCGKMQNKNCLKTKALGFVSDIAWDKLR